MGTATYTDSQVTQGFFGPFDLVSRSGERCWQNQFGGWVARVTGTALSMANGNGYLLASIDGGALNAVSGTTIFTGLADQSHLVHIQAAPGSVPTYSFTPTTGTLFTVTGSTPAIDWGGLGLGPIESFCSGFSGTANVLQESYGTIAGDTNLNSFMVPTRLYNYSSGGSHSFYASGVGDLWLFTADQGCDLAIDGGYFARINFTNFVSGQTQWQHIATGLDTTATHLYSITSGSYLPASQTVAPQAVMIGPSTATFGATKPPTMTMFGDSTAYGQGLASATSPSTPGYASDVDVYRVARAFGYVVNNCGLSGQTTAGLATDISTILSRLATVPTVAWLRIGTNDGPSTANFRTNYQAILSALFTAGTTKVICQTPLGSLSNQPDIAGAVTNFGNSNAIYMPSQSFNGIMTVDGTHPSIGGYQLEAGYAYSYLKPYLSPSTPSFLGGGFSGGFGG